MLGKTGYAPTTFPSLSLCRGLARSWSLADLTITPSGHLPASREREAGSCGSIEKVGTTARRCSKAGDRNVEAFQKN